MDLAGLQKGLAQSKRAELRHGHLPCVPQQRPGPLHSHQEAILEIYDAMADAVRTGQPYRAVLDPPLGHDPRHPG